MKPIIIVIFICLSTSLFAQTITVEAESGTMNGTYTTSSNGVTYVTGLELDNESFTITVNAPTQGTYNTVIRYRSEYKIQDLLLNGTFVSNITIPTSNGSWADLSVGALVLKAGANSVTIKKNWGWSDFDRFTFTLEQSHDYSTTDASLINPNTNQKTKDVYAYLRSNYGKNIISGQTAYWTELLALAGKTPVVRAFDFQPYTVGYPYLWKNGGHTFGWLDDGTTQSAIDWYNSTNGNGIVTFQWHWHSPSGGSVGTNTFYTNSTSFDVTKAVTKNSNEYTAIIRDIDSIASQLKRLQTAGVPVLFRPLHEAGGAWFWWGAKGATACLTLYDILYDRITNYHGLNNLIWVWSSPEANWYPGNTKVDILGYDSYPGAYVYGSQKLTFDQLFTITGGKKMIAMTENGPIPDINTCISDDAMWLYFSSWSDLVATQNSSQHVKDVYAHTKVITLDEVIKPSPNFWHFASDLESWGNLQQMTASVANSMATMTVTAADPQMFSPDNLNFSASDYKYIVVSMQNQTTSSTAEFFWTTTTSTSFDAVKRLAFTVTPNDIKQQYYILDLSSNNNWTGIIKQIRLDPTTASSGTSKIDFIKFVGTKNSSAIAIPGFVESEDYNVGGNNNAYYDIDTDNKGTKYRTTESVDVENTNDSIGVYNVGWIAQGEWMEYLIDVIKTGIYTINCRAAAPDTGAYVHLEIDGEQLGSSIKLAQTGAYQTYSNNEIHATLEEGKHILKMVAETAGFNINYISFVEDINTSINTSTEEQAFLIYPNPAREYIILNFEDDQSIDIINPLGQSVFNSEFIIQNSKFKIDVSPLPSGIYFLKVGDQVQKFIKQ